MTWTPEIRQFVADHLSDDPARLLLSAHRFPGIDVPFAVDQIEARCRLRNKLPEWFALPDLIMGGRIPAEQCSSEATARFKRSIMLPDARSLCDMTGGMGVDFWYMSQGLETAIYTERQPHLCEVARHNFPILTAASESQPVRTQYVVREGLSTELPIPDVDVIFLDPARRSTSGSRIYEISDCEPDVVSWQHELLAHCRQLITKVSPMADVTRTLSRLERVTDLYILSLRGECKELLVSQGGLGAEPNGNVQIHCVDLFPNGRSVSFSYDAASASSATFSWPQADSMKYFYEPDVSIMKAQAFRPLQEKFAVCQLDTDCHYFASDTLVPDFPGRIFCIDELIPFSSRSLKQLRASIPQANIATRAFPLTADQLRARTSIRDGGDVYVFGASLHDVGSLLIRCHKITSIDQ